MLTPEQYADLDKKIEEITDQLTDFLINDIISRVCEAGQITNTAEYNLWILKTSGIGGEELLNRFLEKLHISEEEFEKIIYKYSKGAWMEDYARLKAEATVPFDEIPGIMQLIEGTKNSLIYSIENLTNTIGFAGPAGTFSDLTQAYISASNFAFMQTLTGATDYGTAVRTATRELINRGIRTINYESGMTTEISAAIRRNVMSSIGNVTNEISQINHDELGCDGWEISAHAMCAPDHEHVQGKRYTDKEFEAMNAGLSRKIGTLNCGHIAFPVRLKETEPVYSPSKLQTFKKENSEGLMYEGKHYTLYEATQKQREMERKIRKNKYKINEEKEIAKVTGNQTELKKYQTKEREMLRVYNDFSKKAGLTAQYTRTRGV